MDYIQTVWSGFDITTFSLPKIGVNTIIDIFIVAYLIYKVFVWVKETRAWSLLKGVVVVLVISGLAYWFRLYTLTWIINNTFTAGVLAILVIFQPELRRGLEKIGKSGLSRTLDIFGITLDTDKTTLSETSANEIFKACQKLSEARTGALIVIEQSVALGDFENSGIPIDAVITTQLLVNIFVDKTPLHDGAVLIRNNRVSSACCILPLTASELASELGTRHRASVGVSEVTDAVVIVVSEETGDISIAHDSKLNRKLTGYKFREALNSLCLLDEPKTKGLGLFTRPAKKD